MGIIEELKNRYDGLDEVDRKNLWMGVAGLVLVILLIISLSQAMDTVGSLLGGGASYVNQSAQEMSKAGRGLAKP